MEQRRKAFIDPSWAIGIGCVLAAAFILLFALIGVIPNKAYAQETQCGSAARVKASIKAMAGPDGPELEEIKDKLVLKKLVDYLVSGGLEAPNQPDSLMLIKLGDVTRIAWVKDGQTCGHLSVQGEAQKEIRAIIDGTPMGRDA